MSVLCQVFGLETEITQSRLQINNRLEAFAKLEDVWRLIERLEVVRLK